MTSDSHYTVVYQAISCLMRTRSHNGIADLRAQDVMAGKLAEGSVERHAVILEERPADFFKVEK